MTADLKTKLGMSQGLLTSLTQPCVVVDTNEIITFLNQPELDLLQIDEPPSKFIGMHMSEFVYGDRSRQTLLGKCMREGKIITGQPTASQEARAARAAPTTCWWTSRPSATWTATSWARSPS